ncbi:MAG TPA: hypothetical protein VNC50_09450 [Planctomycetia bacterium]|nr:hypothetical protein [Planctomycetia bacterium]
MSSCSAVPFVLCVASWTMAVDPLPVGFAAVDVTPKLPISLNGGMTDRAARIVHDPLHARCLRVGDAAIVVVDSCMVPDGVVTSARAKLGEMKESLGIDPEKLIVSATHTHTAPTLAPTFQSMPDENYVKELPGKIVAAVKAAVAASAPAEVAFGFADEPNQVFNRRWKMKPGTIGPSPFGEMTDKVKMNPGVGNANLVEPAGPTDPQVFALAARTKGGAKPLGLFANYSLHYVGDVQGDAVSADYYGEFARRIKERRGGDNSGFVGVLSNGTSGNINNVNFRVAHPKAPPFGRIKLVADAVADAAEKALAGAKYEPVTVVRSAHRTLMLGVRKPTEAEITRAKGIVAAKKGPQLAGLEEVYAGETLDMANYPDEVPVRVQALRIGTVGIVAIPCEVFVEIGLAIKAQCPLKPTITISLANGYAGYLPTEEHHRLGGYETWRAKSSFLATDAAPKIQAAALELLAEVAR